MKALQKPFSGTILYGLISALLLIPSTDFLDRFFPWAEAFRLTIFFILSGYALLLAIWGRVHPVETCPPLLIVFGLCFTGISVNAFFFLIILTLAWIRSGRWEGPGHMKRAATEVSLIIAAGAFVALFLPHSRTSMALGVWLFFLVQSLYFLVLPLEEKEKDAPSEDGFDTARRRAERILNG